MAKGFVFDDGGRGAAGFKGSASDCVTRAIAIVSGKPYAEIYAELATGTGSQRRSRHQPTKKSATARSGVSTSRKWFKDYMTSLGFKWVPTMKIGQGCKVHLCADELPGGRIVVAVSRHYTAMIDGTIHDTHDPRRDESWIFEPDTGQELKPGQGRNENGVWTRVGGRCVYGYFAAS